MSKKVNIGDKVKLVRASMIGGKFYETTTTGFYGGAKYVNGKIEHVVYGMKRNGTMSRKEISTYNATIEKA
jgi:hypothetical protein